MNIEDERRGLNSLAWKINPQHRPFTAVSRTGGTRADLIDNVKKGDVTIVGVSWGSGPAGRPPRISGHSLVVVGYNSSTGDLAFLDSVGGALRKEADFPQQYHVAFSVAWQQQPNWDFWSGDMLTLSLNP